MPPMNLPVTIWGRPVKPVALGLAIMMLIFAIFNVLNLDVFYVSIWGDVVGLTAFASFAIFTVAWIINSQRLAEYGLALAAGVFIARCIALLLINGWEAQGVYFSAGAAIIAAGSYFLERTDPRGFGGGR